MKSAALDSTAEPSAGRPLLAWALLGPAVIGAWIALRVGLSDVPVGDGGVGTFARLALGVPLAIVGAAVLTAPALYIGSAFVNVSLRPGAMLREIAVGLDGAGLVMLGLMPAVLFLGATISDPIVASAIASMALAGAVVFGVRLLFGRLYPTGIERVKAIPVYVCWAAVSLGIGAMLLARVVKGAV